jgi:hypothetical protein
MAEKNILSRVMHKNDLEENWSKASGFAPKKGELIVYNADSKYNHPRFKIGETDVNVNDLPFLSPYETIVTQAALGSGVTINISSESNYKTYRLVTTEGSNANRNIKLTIANSFTTANSIPEDFNCTIELELTKGQHNGIDITWNSKVLADQTLIFIPRIIPKVDLSNWSTALTVSDETPSFNLNQINLPNDATSTINNKMKVRLNFKYAFGTIVVDPEVYLASLA